MKIRKGFVSNSSSASFIVFKAGLTEEQIELIKNYEEVCERLCEQGTRLDLYGYEDGWSITETDLTVEGYTHMDNFNMGEYFRIVVGVDPKYIRWDYA